MMCARTESEKWESYSRRHGKEDGRGCFSSNLRRHNIMHASAPSAHANSMKGFIGAVDQLFLCDSLHLLLLPALVTSRLVHPRACARRRALPRRSRLFDSEAGHVAFGFRSRSRCTCVQKPVA
eukprot:3720666-Pleurochrysis_carterae.AAC.3